MYSDLQAGYKVVKRKVKRLVKGTVGLGMGAAVLGSVGGTTAGYGVTALGNVGKALPVAGTAIGAGMVLRSMRYLKVKKRKN